MVVSKVEPPVLPSLVRRQHRALDVEVGMRLPHLERAAPDLQGLLDSTLVPG